MVRLRQWSLNGGNHEVKYLQITPLQEISVVALMEETYGFNKWICRLHISHRDPTFAK